MSNVSVRETHNNGPEKVALIYWTHTFLLLLRHTANVGNKLLLFHLCDLQLSFR